MIREHCESLRAQTPPFFDHSFEPRRVFNASSEIDLIWRRAAQEIENLKRTGTIRRNVKLSIDDQIVRAKTEVANSKISLDSAVKEFATVQMPSLKTLVRSVAQKRKLRRVSKSVEASALSWVSAFLQPEFVSKIFLPK